MISCSTITKQQRLQQSRTIRMLKMSAISAFDSTSLLSPKKPHFSLTAPNLTFRSKNASFLSSSSQQQQQTHLGFNRRDNGLSLFCVSAFKKNRRKDNNKVKEEEVVDVDEIDVEDLDDFDDFDEDETEEELEMEDGDYEQDGAVFLPFAKMRRWLEKKPLGFGEGKEYDTSVEEKLLQEIEQSRQAQLANINKLKLKGAAVKGVSPKKDDQKKKAPEVIPSGIRVRLINLPKKKNIHRDLKAAFEGVPGIVSISPAVSGNKKTKDPICKGFAFVYFKSEEDATRFVQIFSTKSILFGKVEKQIKCEMVDSNSPKSADELSANNTYSGPVITVPRLKVVPDAGFISDDDSLDSRMEVAFDGSDSDDDLDFSELEDIRENLELFSVSELNGDEKTKRDKKEISDGSDSHDDLDFSELEDIRENLELFSVSELNGGEKTKRDKKSATDSFSSNPRELSGSEKPKGDKKPATDLFSSNPRIQELAQKIIAKGNISLSELNDEVKTRGDKKPAKGSSSSDKRKKIQVIGKKLITEGKVKKVPKLTVPGSAKRLKVKEKAVLTNVLSKYAAMKEES